MSPSQSSESTPDDILKKYIAALVGQMKEMNIPKIEIRQNGSDYAEIVVNRNIYVYGL